VYRTESLTRPGRYHYTMKLRDGGIICTCEGWQYNGYCKHIEDVPILETAADVIRRWRTDGKD